jgi:hypothetical protein
VIDSNESVQNPELIASRQSSVSREIETHSFIRDAMVEKVEDGGDGASSSSSQVDIILGSPVCAEPTSKLLEFI